MIPAKEALEDIFLANQESDECVHFSVCGSYKDSFEVSIVSNLNWLQKIR